MKLRKITCAVVLASMLTWTGMAGAKERKGAADTTMPMSASSIIAKWPEMPKKAAQELMSKYGQPDEMTPSHLIWKDRGPFAKTEIQMHEIPHKFPMAHTDFLKSTVYHSVPWDKFDELAAYDGSVIVERTAGTISARCDKEEMNILALNLAHDITTGKRDVEGARRFYAETAMAFKRGERPEYTQRLMFATEKMGASGDADSPYMMK